MFSKNTVEHCLKESIIEFNNWFSKYKNTPNYPDIKNKFLNELKKKLKSTEYQDDINNNISHKNISFVIENNIISNLKFISCYDLSKIRYSNSSKHIKLMCELDGVLKSIDLKSLKPVHNSNIIQDKYSEIINQINYYKIK